MYLGEINHRGKSYPGEHPPILTQTVFDAVQAKLEENLQPRRQKRAASEALLLGRIFDDRGNRMTPIFAVKQGVRYRYYVSCVLAQGRKEEAGSLPRISAPDLEEAVVRAIQTAFEGDQRADDRLPKQLIEENVRRVVVSRTAVEMTWLTTSEWAASMPIRIPWASISHPRRDIILPETKATDLRPQRAEARTRLLAAVAIGRRWLAEARKDGVSDLEALAEREEQSVRSARSTMALAFLSPRIVRTLVEGRLPRAVGVVQLVDLPLSWRHQEQLIER
jgi:site-specific DNA recombinase